MAKCIMCGFLSLRNAQTDRLEEIPGNRRSAGSFALATYGGIHCSEKVFCLELEMRQAGGTGREQYQEIVNKERDCPRFTEWIEGYSPRDHRDMYNEKMLLEIQETQREKERVWQDEQKRKEREYHEEQRHRDREWQEEQRRQDQERQRQQREDDRAWQLNQKMSDRRWQFGFLFAGAVLTAIGAVVVKATTDKAIPTAPAPQVTAPAPTPKL